MAKRKNIRDSYIQRVIRTDPCAYCGSPEGGTKDHIQPRSNNGISSWVNYTGSCMMCNTRKGSNSLLGFLLKVDIPGQELEEGDYQFTRDLQADSIYKHYPLHSLLGILYYTGQSL